MNPLKAIWKGLKKTGTVVAKIDDVIDEIPMLDQAMVMIPVAGPIIKLALDHIDVAQELIPGDGRGPKRRESAKALLRADMRKLGFENEFANEVIALAFLLRQGKAGIMRPTTEDESEGG